LFSFIQFLNNLFGNSCGLIVIIMGSRQVAIVTGANGGYGRSLLTQLRGKNWSIVAHGKSQEDSEPFKDDANIKWVYGDLSEDRTIKNIVNCCQENFKRCDCLILNAAMIEPIVEIAKMDMMMMRKHFDVNFFACVELTKMCMMMLKESKGKVIGVTADCAQDPTQGCSCYCCSKAALNMMIQCLAGEQPDLICCAFDPSEMRTGMHDVMMEEGKQKMKDDFQKVAQAKPVHPDQPAQALMKMMRHATRDMSGKVIRWDDQRIANMK